MAFVLRGGSVKNKIIAITLLVVAIIPMFSFVSADTIDLYSILPNYEDLSEPYNNYFNNGFFLHTTTYGSHYLYVFKEPETKCYVKSTSENYFLCFDKETYYIRVLNDGSFSGTFNSVTANFDNISIPVELAESYYLSTVPIYKSKSSTEIVLDSNYTKDDTIGDPSSDLQLSYEYNEDYTSCHIDATIKGGAFTDKIYYSNYQPGITGELLTKRGFPKERYRYY